MKIEGKIGIKYLKEIWEYYDGLKHSRAVEEVEWKYINAVFNTLGIGLEPTIKHLMNSSLSFTDFETWIEQNGRISREEIARFNAIIDGQTTANSTITEKVFSEEDMIHWEKEGYVILKNAIPKVDCLEAINLICDKIGANINDPSTWYASHPLKQGIMIQLFNAEILDKNRLSKKIRLGFEQLWNSKNLVVSMDRVSFNPPETASYKFPGPNLHWDVSLKQPIPYGIQGLLYLTDTEADQGAFTVIPGFHRSIDAWLSTLKSNPREIDLLEQFEEKPIVAEAGNFIYWNHCLPHGSRPNYSSSPRIVQYINYQPIHLEYQKEWI